MAEKGDDGDVFNIYECEFVILFLYVSVFLLIRKQHCLMLLLIWNIFIHVRFDFGKIIQCFDGKVCWDWMKPAERNFPSISCRVCWFSVHLFPFDEKHYEVCPKFFFFEYETRPLRLVLALNLRWCVFCSTPPHEGYKIFKREVLRFYNSLFRSNRIEEKSLETFSIKINSNLVVTLTRWISCKFIKVHQISSMRRAQKVIAKQTWFIELSMISGSWFTLSAILPLRSLASFQATVIVLHKRGFLLHIYLTCSSYLVARIFKFSVRVRVRATYGTLNVITKLNERYSILPKCTITIFTMNWMFGV